MRVAASTRGEHETRLRASVARVRDADVLAEMAVGWRTSIANLDDADERLRSGIRHLRDDEQLGRNTREQAIESFRAMRKFIEEQRTVFLATARSLERASDAMSRAVRLVQRLDQEGPLVHPGPAPAPDPLAAPGSDQSEYLRLVTAHDQATQAFTAAATEREQRAKRALDNLDEQFTRAEERIRAVHEIPRATVPPTVPPPPPPPPPPPTHPTGCLCSQCHRCGGCARCHGADCGCPACRKAHPAGCSCPQCAHAAGCSCARCATVTGPGTEPQPPEVETPGQPPTTSVGGGSETGLTHPGTGPTVPGAGASPAPGTGLTTAAGAGAAPLGLGASLSAGAGTTGGSALSARGAGPVGGSAASARGVGAGGAARSGAGGGRPGAAGASGAGSRGAGSRGAGSRGAGSRSAASGRAAGAVGAGGRGGRRNPADERERDALLGDAAEWLEGEDSSPGVLE